MINTEKGCRRLLKLRNCFHLQPTWVISSYVVLQAAYVIVDTGPEVPPQVEFCASLEWEYIYTRTYSWKPDTNTLELDRLHHDCIGVCFIALQYASINFVSIYFHSRKERLGVHLKNVVFYYFFNFVIMKLRHSRTTRSFFYDACYIPAILTKIWIHSSFRQKINYLHEIHFCNLLNYKSISICRSEERKDSKNSVEESVTFCAM